MTSQRRPHSVGRHGTPGWRRWLFALCSVPLAAISTAHAGADCNITAVSLNFGVYDPALASPDDAAGTVTVTCAYTPPGATRVAYSILLSGGMNSPVATDRRMAAGTATLGYNVYLDAARSQVWGNGFGGTVIASGTMTLGPGQGNGTRTQVHPVYGRIPGLQDAVPGTYVDTLVLSLNY
jgi:spore coat protein U-like protein